MTIKAPYLHSITFIQFNIFNKPQISKGLRPLTHHQLKFGISINIPQMTQLKINKPLPRLNDSVSTGVDDDAYDDHFTTLGKTKTNHRKRQVTIVNKVYVSQSTIYLSFHDHRLNSSRLP